MSLLRLFGLGGPTSKNHSELLHLTGKLVEAAQSGNSTRAASIASKMRRSYTRLYDLGPDAKTTDTQASVRSLLADFLSFYEDCVRRLDSPIPQLAQMQVLMLTFAGFMISDADRYPEVAAVWKRAKHRARA